MFSLKFLVLCPKTAFCTVSWNAKSEMQIVLQVMVIRFDIFCISVHCALDLVPSLICKLQQPLKDLHVSFQYHYSHCVPSYLIHFEEDASHFLIFWSTYIFKNGERKKKLNPTMAFGDSQLASSADSAKIWSDVPEWPHWLAGYLWWPS